MAQQSEDLQVVFQPTDSQPRTDESVSESPLRKPFAPEERSDSPAITTEQSALASRYRYYSRLDPSDRSLMRMPDHVVPNNFFSVVPFQDGDKKQHSIITIFSIWNTMVGTSLLSLPWAMAQAGLILGMLIIVSMGIIAAYTAYRVVQSAKNTVVLGSTMVEFSDVCRYHFGKWGERVALVFSLITLVGACVVYWVLMSNFLYHTVNVIYETASDTESGGGLTPMENISLTCDVICRDGGQLPAKNVTSGDTFHRLWDLQKTVPFFLVLLVFPLLNFKSPTFFTKFNGLGTISVVYLLVFVFIKASECGLHVNISSRDAINYTPLFSTHFVALSGILALSYFIHNCILSILQNQRNPENNVRDMSISYVLVGITYFIMGVVFYVAFPLLKSCISENFLDNFSGGDLFSSVARVFLLFQMCTVLPLIIFLIRVQLFGWLFGSGYPSLIHVIGLNGSVVVLSLLFAVFYPKVGTIIGFVGSFSGLAYVFTLPCLVYLAEQKAEGKLTTTKVAVHATIILLGLANFLGQFVRLFV